MMHRVTAVVGLLALAGGVWGAGQQRFVVTEVALSGAPIQRHTLGIDAAGRLWGMEQYHATPNDLQYRLFSYEPTAGVTLAPLPAFEDVRTSSIGVGTTGEVLLTLFEFGGDAPPAGNRRGYRYSPASGVLHPIAGDMTSGAASSNATGDAVGVLGEGDSSTLRATIFRANGAIETLGTFGGSWSAAYAMNDSGTVVGAAATTEQDVIGSGYHAFIASAERGMVDLGTLGGVSSSAKDINAHGAVVGFAANGEPGDVGWGGAEAFIYTEDAGMESLGRFEHQRTAEANAINNLGWVVGAAHAWDGVYPSNHFVWSEATGLVDLNDLLPADRDWTFENLLDINDAGQIAAVVVHDGEWRAARITVALVPAPAGAALAGLALLVGARRRRH